MISFNIHEFMHVCKIVTEIIIHDMFFFYYYIVVLISIIVIDQLSMLSVNLQDPCNSAYLVVVLFSFFVTAKKSSIYSSCFVMLTHN